jgi:short-subunit dehydrogenase
VNSRKVIIIGATSGIGRTLARLYAKAGWMVGVTGRRKELLMTLQQEFAVDRPGVAETPQRIVTEDFDTMGKDNIAHLESLLNKLGGLDLLIYNSGFGEVTENLDWDVDRKIVNTNVNGFIEITNWAFNYFHRKGGGHIAATSSIGGNRGSSYAPAYSASKAFMSNYMEGLYLKARRLKVKIYITDIQPGFVNTKMAKGNKQFWVIPVEKAARQIYNAIEKKKFRVYVSRRWWLIAKLMRLMPLAVYRQFG